MRNLTLEEIVNNKKFEEFCELSNYSSQKIINNLGSSFSVELLDDEECEDTDMNYPYKIYNPFGIDINND
jgi:hypothetical protein